MYNFFKLYFPFINTIEGALMAEGWMRKPLTQSDWVHFQPRSEFLCVRSGNPISSTAIFHDTRYLLMFFYLNTCDGKIKISECKLRDQLMVQPDAFTRAGFCFIQVASDKSTLLLGRVESRMNCFIRLNQSITRNKPVFEKKELLVLNV